MSSEFKKNNEHTVTSFISKEITGKLSNRRVLFHVEKRLGVYSKEFQKITGILPPVSVALCPTPRCVRTCTFCSNISRNRIHIRKKVSYSDNLFKRIVSDLNYMRVQGVTLAGGGEPTVYEGGGLWNLFSNRQFFQVGLHTNGAAISKTKLLDLSSSPCLRYINLSFVAHTHELYTKITGSSAEQFNSVEKFLSKYPKILRKTGSSQEFSVKVLICRENHEYVREMVAYLKKASIINILLRCVANFEKEQNVELDQKQKTKLRAILRKMDIPISQTNMILGISPGNIPVPKRCWINTLMYTAGIDPDGEVYLCSPYSFPKYSIGNVNKTDFKNLWHGKRHFEIIDFLNQKCISGECNILACRHYYSNLAIDAFIAGKIKPLNENELDANYGMFI